MFVHNVHELLLLLLIILGQDHCYMYEQAAIIRGWNGHPPHIASASEFSVHSLAFASCLLGPNVLAVAVEDRGVGRKECKSIYKPFFFMFINVLLSQVCPTKLLKYESFGAFH